MEPLEPGPMDDGLVPNVPVAPVELVEPLVAPTVPVVGVLGLVLCWSGVRDGSVERVGSDERVEVVVSGDTASVVGLDVVVDRLPG
jgi:hypothetical protein